LTIPASLGASITDLNVVGLDISHTYISDLTVRLRSPSGTTVTLFDQICGSDADILMNLDDQASTSIFPCPPLGGVTIRPSNPLSAFNGQSSTGTWTLTVIDNVTDDGGSLNGWGLSINNNSNTCTLTPTPLATTYTFTGNGNWNVASNWSGGAVPPSVLPAGESIVINHVAGGNCVLNVNQTINPGAIFTVVTGKNLLVQGNLNIR
jgi:subtilisin-like proprotein convertase family protein